VLTTNFDNLLQLAFGTGGLVTIADPGQYGLITTNPSRPQLIYLHGMAEHYQDRVLANEVASLDTGLVSRVVPLIRDHPVVVVGYRGSEPSVMRGLFADHVEEASGFRRGVFWCVRDTDAEIHPFVRDLATHISANFAWVPIASFDGLLAELADLWNARQPSASPVHSAQPVADPVAAVSFDLRASEINADEADWSSLVPVLQAYAHRLELPTGQTAAWALQVATGAGLVRASAGADRLTNAGALLLTDARRAATGAWVQLHFPGKPPQAVDGTLWEQFDRVLQLLGTANKPIRMKGVRSATLHPYPEGALKEVIANALIHRDYEQVTEINIEVTPEAITVRSPGGLESHLRQRLLRGDATTSADTPPDLMQRALTLGERGRELTGYRNRVLADLFYGTGLVDKAGSGLADAFQQLEAAGGALRAELGSDNRSFTVVLRRRPARVDQATDTAQPAQPSTLLRLNAFEVTALPQKIWSAPTHLRFGDLRGADFHSVPAHVLYDGRLYTFSDLDDPENPLRGYVNLSGVTIVDRNEWSDAVQHRRLVHLMHEVLFRHLGSLGLTTDFRDRLAYYPCRNAVARYVEYRSRAREKQRRRVSHWPGETRRYCEHKAARLEFSRHGDGWLLSVLPTYVFTTDGARARIVGREASSLATRASQEEYNLKVVFDLVFWGSVITGGAPQGRLEAGSGTAIELSTRPITAEATPLHEVEGATSAPAGTVSAR
jgi:hypothetical protein